MDETDLEVVPLSFPYIPGLWILFLCWFCVLSLNRLGLAIVSITPQNLTLCIKDIANQYNLYKMNGGKITHIQENGFANL